MPVMTTRRSLMVGKRLKKVGHKARNSNSLYAPQTGRRLDCSSRFAPGAIFPLLLAAFFNVLDDVADRLKFLGVFVGDLRAKLLFKSHHQFHRVEGVGAQIFDEFRLGRHLVGFDAELFDNDVLYPLVNRFVSRKFILPCLYAMNPKIVKP